MKSKGTCSRCRAVNLLPAGVRDLSTVTCGVAGCGGALEPTRSGDRVTTIVTHAIRSRDTSVMRVPAPSPRTGIHRTTDGQGLMFPFSPKLAAGEEGVQ